MPLSNSYSLKTTKDQQRPCFICGKSSSTVLDAVDDFFFVCLSHTRDNGFCTSESVGLKKDTQTETLKKDTQSAGTKKDILPDGLNKDGKDSKGPTDSKDSKGPIDSIDGKGPSDSKDSNADGPKIYKLHRAILFLREKEKEKKVKLNLLKSLK